MNTFRRVRRERVGNEILIDRAVVDALVLVGDFFVDQVSKTYETRRQGARDCAAVTELCIVKTLFRVLFSGCSVVLMCFL